MMTYLKRSIQLSHRSKITLRFEADAHQRKNGPKSENFNELVAAVFAFGSDERVVENFERAVTRYLK